jgi:hypothetical protein
MTCCHAYPKPLPWAAPGVGRRPAIQLVVTGRKDRTARQHETGNSDNEMKLGNRSASFQESKGPPIRVRQAGSQTIGVRFRTRRRCMRSSSFLDSSSGPMFLVVISNTSLRTAT